MITHDNLLHQLGANAEDLGLGPDVRAVSWLPQFHDFGLVSAILSALVGNGHLHFLSPLAFVRRPAAWLEVMSRVRATHTAAPNFAFDLAVRKTTPAERARYDLRSLRVVMSAAEPILPATVDAFLDAFAPSGLARDAFCPAYGLAEHTVGVSVFGRRRVRVDRGALEIERTIVPATASTKEPATLVGCGAPSRGVRVAVVDPETRARVPAGSVGELWVASRSVGAGYFGQPEASEETFRARLAGPDDDGTTWLRTGDLGAVFEGEIFVTGRAKDLVIVRGRNVHPHDVEIAIRDAHPLIRPGGVAVFGVPAASAEDGEALVAFVEVRATRLDRADADAIVGAVREAVHARVKLGHATVVLGLTGLVRKTTSGKIRRAACRAAWLDGSAVREARTLHVARDEGRVDDADAAPAPSPLARLMDVDEPLRSMIADVAQGFGQRARVRGGRATHTVGTVARGVLEVTPDPRVPAHSLLARPARHAVLLRHANIKGFGDDAVLDGRGATLRVLARGHDEPHEALLDVTTSTGPRFFARDAASFHAWFGADLEGRAKLVAERPEIGDIVHEILRDPSSYTELWYFSQTVFRFLAEDHVPRLVRYRIVPAARTPDAGTVPRERLALPLDHVPRRPDDPRSPRYLQDDLRRRVVEGGVRYVLEIQLHDARLDDAALDRALDCTRTWDEATSPWLVVGTITLDGLVDDATAESLAFSPFRAPPELAMPLARRATDAASVNHLRAVSYELSAQMRRGLPIDPALLVAPSPKEEALDARALLERAAAALDLRGVDASLEPAAAITAALTASALGKNPALLREVLSRFPAAAEALLEADDVAPPAALSAFTARYERVLAAAGASGADDAVRSHAPFTLRQGVWRHQPYARLMGPREVRAFFETGIGADPLVEVRSAVNAVRRLGEDTFVVLSRFTDVRAKDGRVDATEFVATMTITDATCVFRTVVQTRDEALPFGDADEGRAVADRFLAAPVDRAALARDLCRGLAADLVLQAFESLSARPRARRALRPKDGRSQRIGVLGAGVTGLTLAYELERRGHRVTVLERSSVVGGKCEAFTKDGLTYDLGGHFCTGVYRELWDLARELGVDTVPTTPFHVHDAALGRVIPPNDAAFAPAAHARWLDYRARELPHADRPGLAPIAAALAAPVSEWLDSTGLRALADTFGPSYTASGYGFLDDASLPAAYFVKLVEMTGLLREPDRSIPGAWTIAGGLMALFGRMADALADLRTGVAVRGIRRGDDGVHVTTDDGTLELDAIFVTTPDPALLDVLDARDEERDLFARVRTIDYRTYVATIEGLPRQAFHLVRAGNGERPSVIAFHHRHAAADVYTVYAYGRPGASDAEQEAIVRAELARLGGTVRAMHLVKPWGFMPYLSPDDVRAGFFERMEARQGQDRTYLAGSVLAFELVECNVAYARALVARFFPAEEDASEAARAAGEAPTGSDAPSIARWLVDRVAAETRRAPADVDPHASLETFALDSLATLGLLGDLSTLVGRRVPPSVMLEHPTLAAIAAHVAALAPASAARPAPDPAPVDVARDALLEPLGAAERFAAEPGSLGPTVLVTGATGFLGGYLAADLLATTRADVVCLVRGSDEAAARKRLEASLRALGRWDDAHAARLRVVAGDLAEPRLGLDAATWSRLAETVTSIVHAGAWVNWVSDYATLRGPNVEGTRELLRLAAAHAKKTFHHVSSRAVFDASAFHGQLVDEATDPRTHEGIESPYGRTKWAAERLAAAARAEGLAVTIHRPAFVTGDSRTGAANPRDFVFRLLQSAAQRGAIVDGDAELDLVPVDWASRAIVAIALDPCTSGRAWHTMSPAPVPLREVRDALVAAGFHVEAVPTERWLESLARADASDPLRVLAPVLAHRDAQGLGFVERQAARARFSSEATRARLPSSLVCPPARDLVAHYVTRMIEAGQLPRPPR
jgi:thioester reductase-like protein